MQKKNLIALATALLFITATANAQNVVTGIVKDADTGETLPGVNVYFSRTTIGDATDNKGFYKLTTTETGVYNLIFSYVGYKRAVIAVELSGSTSRTINASLTPRQFEMKELKVSDSNKEWQKNFAKFRDEFIGNTDFADETTIENPTIIDFSKKDDRLIATVPQPLVVTNRALGYKLHIELESFVWSEGADGYYKIYPSFQLLEPDNAEEGKKWRENREKVYNYSRRYFLKNLYHETMKGTDFTLLNPEVLIRYDRYDTQRLLASKPNLSPQLIKQMKGFKITVQPPKGLHINYVKYHNYKYTHRSVLIPNTKSKNFYIDSNGIMLDPLSLKFRGFLGNHRLANQLPYDYKSE